MFNAIIYRKSKSSTQSGMVNTKKWYLQVLNDKKYKQETLMGWVANLDNKDQIVLSFDSLDEAKTYAEKNQIAYEVKEYNEIKRERKSYSSNLTKDPNLYYY